MMTEGVMGPDGVLSGLKTTHGCFLGCLCCSSWCPMCGTLLGGKIVSHEKRTATGWRRTSGGRTGETRYYSPAGEVTEADYFAHTGRRDDDAGGGGDANGGGDDAQIAASMTYVTGLWFEGIVKGAAIVLPIILLLSMSAGITMGVIRVGVRGTERFLALCRRE